MKYKLLTVYAAIHNLLLIRTKLVFLSEKSDWIVKNISQNLSRQLNQKKLINSTVSFSCINLKNKIVNFGSAHVFATIRHHLHPSNIPIISWFHINQRPLEKDMAVEIKNRHLTVHTSCQTTKNGLIKMGIDEKQIKVIPLGINLSIFSPRKSNQESKTNLGLPKDKIIVGSFQKDGNGWNEGNEPKLIKGPDIFCDVIERLSKKFPIHVLLTGPARGYVKNRLTAAGIPFTHHYLKHYKDIVPYYHALDLYLIASRVEGGPMALLESWATGVPLVATPVGMVPDICIHEKNALISKSFNPEELAALAERLLTDTQLTTRLTENGLQKVKLFDWPLISKQYFNILFKPLI